MSAILFTVDTELSLMAQLHGEGADDNLVSAVYGRTARGDYGVGYQVERLNSHGIKGVFFVEALHSVVLGDEPLHRIVDTILTGGHEVQLHLHVEWLWWAEGSRRAQRSTRGMANLDLDSQRALLVEGADALERCGAPRPTAFRAGGFEANEATLAAAAAAGMRYDSSYNARRIGAGCQMRRRDDPCAPFVEGGIIEIPLTCFRDYGEHVRQLQLCAVSSSELETVLATAKRRGDAVVNILSHSFELLNRARSAPNRIVLDRFEKYCRIVAKHGGSATFSDLDSTEMQGNLARAPQLGMISSSIAKTGARMVQQAFGHVMYDRHGYKPAKSETVAR